MAAEKQAAFTDFHEGLRAEGLKQNIIMQEKYRLSVMKDGKLYKALSHSVEEDESLFVMNRNPPPPRHIASGIPRLWQGAELLNGRRMLVQADNHSAGHVLTH